MYQLKERRMVELDVAMAKHYLEYNNYKLQRKIRPAHVKELAQKMIDGRFRFGEVAFVSLNGDPDMMMNGQHVCNAVITSGITVPCMLEKYKAETELDVSMLRRNFENLVISINDLIACEHYALRLVWPPWLSRLIIGAACIEVSDLSSYRSSPGTGKINPGKHVLSKENKVELLQKYREEGKWIYRLLNLDHGTERGKHLTRAVVVLMIFKAMRIDEEDAFKFFRAVRDGEFLSKDSPQMRLRDFLMQFRLTDRAKHKTSNHEIAYKIALAWNAFRTDTNTNLAYRIDKPVPKLK